MKQEQEQEVEQKLAICKECIQEIVHECREDANPRRPLSTCAPPPLSPPSASGDEMNNEDKTIDGGQSDQESQPQCTPCQDRPNNDPKIDGVFFDNIDVILAIDDIPNGASPGPDGVPPCLLKKSKVYISRMLVKIYQSSFETGAIPDILKLALVSPIHKGGSRADPAQYRPISLTSHIIKVLERMLRKDLIRYLEFHEKMDKNQHGSRGKRSCLSQLLEHHLEILDMLEKGENVDLVYLDFAKAFDKCDIDLLLHKVKALGITGKLGRWINSFLKGRKQHILVNGVKSKESDVVSGVPQGTVLGPLLFLIYISDIGENVESTLKVYVDDTKTKKSIKEESDVELLQKDLDQMYSWASANNMKFNGTKFQLMRFGENDDLKDNTLYFTEEMKEVIERFEIVKDLGVIMNESANFTNHLEHAVKKARQKMGWIMRTFHTRNTWFMKHMFKTLVVPHLDYCSQLWMPIDASGIQSLEKVQYDFFKRIPELREKSYWDALEHMKMVSIQRRMERYRIIYSWKILENLAPNCGISEIDESHLSRQGRRLDISVPKGSAKVNKMKEQCFQINGAKLFNCLPPTIRNLSTTSKEKSRCAPDVDYFKAALDQYLASIPDQPRIGGLAPGVESNSILHQTKRGQTGGLPSSSGA